MVKAKNNSFHKKIVCISALILFSGSINAKSATHTLFKGVLSKGFTYQRFVRSGKTNSGPGKKDFNITGISDTTKTKKMETQRLTRVRYNNPGLLVDLGVGLWASPFPVDYTGNGKKDLLVSCGGTSYNGIYLFKGASGKKNPMIFNSGVRLSASPAGYNMRLSYLNNSWVITQPGEFYPDYKNSRLKNGVKIPFEPNFHTGRTHQWEFFDYDGNGTKDLIIGTSDWREYRWDDAYKENGEWTNGPLRGYVYWIKNNGSDEKPAYGKPKKIMAGEQPVESFGMPSPNFADFSGDGLPDLILGSFLDTFTFFKNIGSRTHPEYAKGMPLKYKGKVIKMDLEMIQPAAVDWDNDEHVDLVVGQEDGRVVLLKNTGHVINGVPEFKPPKFFKQRAENVKFGVLSTPYGADWDGDGKEDLIAGNSAGYIGFIKNLGGFPPKWAAPKYMKAGGKVIRIMAGENGSIQGPAEAKWGYTVPTVADWNNDGLPDIIINSILGKIMWYENIGTRMKPKLAPAKPVKVQWEGKTPKPIWNWWNPEGQNLVTQWRSTAQGIDLNKDGLMDLVGLDQEGFLVYYERQKIGGKLKLMSPKRVFYVPDGDPAVFNGKGGPVSFRGGSGNINGWSDYDNKGDLLYVGRDHRSSSPTSIPSLFRIRGIKQFEQQQAKGLTPLRLNAGWAGSSGRVKFHLVDWNGDGKIDLIINSNANVDFFENISKTPGKFVFKNRGKMDDYVIGGHSTDPTTVDWNKDGIPDLLVGAEDGFFYYKENPNSIK